MVHPGPACPRGEARRPDLHDDLGLPELGVQGAHQVLAGISHPSPLTRRSVAPPGVVRQGLKGLLERPAGLEHGGAQTLKPLTRGKVGGDARDQHHVHPRIQGQAATQSQGMDGQLTVEGRSRRTWWPRRCGDSGNRLTLRTPTSWRVSRSARPSRRASVGHPREQVLVTGTTGRDEHRLDRVRAEGIDDRSQVHSCARSVAGVGIQSEDVVVDRTHVGPPAVTARASLSYRARLLSGVR
jgi:hypothetical protein